MPQTESPRLSNPNTRQPQEPPCRKSVLFCPNCNHESSIDGDWIVQATENQQQLRCPNCDNPLPARPSFSETDESNQNRRYQSSELMITIFSVCMKASVAAVRIQVTMERQQIESFSKVVDKCNERLEYGENENAAAYID